MKLELIQELSETQEDAFAKATVARTKSKEQLKAFKKELTNVEKAIKAAWVIAKGMDIDYEEFLKVAGNVSKETLAELDE